MRVDHGDHRHDVYLLDSGTMDTEVEVDNKTFTYLEADRCRDGQVKASWLRWVAEDVCDNGLLENEEEG